MISFILCSINSRASEAVCQNIRSTVGCECECIVIDNKTQPRSIAQVYNEGAYRAKGQVLCFVHEDVRFLTSDFGPAIERKALQSQTGVIGFLGTQYKAQAPSGWYVHNDLSVKHYIQSGHRGTEECVTHNLSSDGFTPAVVVDGCCMFVCRETWASYPFDTQLITGFHCYDVDFCLTLHHAGLTNYVCSLSLMEHQSYGSYNIQWIETTLSLHRGKWHGRLPMFAKDLTLTSQQQMAYEHHAWYDFLKKCVKTDVPMPKVVNLMLEARAQGISRAKLFKLCYKALYYRLLNHLPGYSKA